MADVTSLVVFSGVVYLFLMGVPLLIERLEEEEKTHSFEKVLNN